MRSQLVELDNPPPPDGYIPASIFDVVPAVRELLVTAEELKAELQAQKAQEAKEAKDAKDAKNGID